MKIAALHIGQKVKHQQYGVGVVKRISEHAAEVRFDDALRTVDPERSEMTPAEPTASLTGLEMPLEQLLSATIETVLERMGYENPNAVIEHLQSIVQKQRRPVLVQGRIGRKFFGCRFPIVRIGTCPGDKLQIPNSKLQRSTKLQTQKPTCAPLAAAFVFEVWGLRIGTSLELGVWCLVLGVSLGGGSKTERRPCPGAASDF